MNSNPNTYQYENQITNVKNYLWACKNNVNADQKHKDRFFRGLLTDYHTLQNTLSRDSDREAKHKANAVIQEVTKYLCENGLLMNQIFTAEQQN